jgi:enamine deaminase RidA (YjgF/YER057c/UK114 family)
MIKKQCFSFTPEKATTADSQFLYCINELAKTLKLSGYSFKDIIRQSVFVKAENNAEFVATKQRLIKILDEQFDSFVPPTGFIGQPPENDKLVALEVLVAVNMTDAYKIQYKNSGDVKYAVIQNTEIKEVHAVGLSSSDLSEGTGEQANIAFGQMKAILEQEELEFSDIVRQWNYIENIVGVKSENQELEQNYQQFNDVRSEYYNSDTFKNGFPAATGIGMNVGGVILDFVAFSPAKNISIHPVQNPHQIDAHQYSDKVLIGGDCAKKTTPKFERAKVVSNNTVNEVFISGTAAILGQETINQQKIADQTLATIQNINNLISFDNLKANGVKIGENLITPSYLRVYVKNSKDIPMVKKICNEYISNVPTLYLESDICRDNLVVEIEGIAGF